ncbi:hypothetical protein GCM10025768_12960 [Microbacterium pseudoresistens]|uniref:DUF4352 domain-containing protein n=1 Tax=Microbacterium pseudoresistens TaxID=640634 RepID=A0A7Y9EWE5_9MICO|nr:hypothetical protein [Microbacterium pseudoresistens]NYD55199.1 hypothetical protein [Microbacterium pseudoresistens]
MSAAGNILPPRRPPSWWRRNRVALIALALLVPLTFGVIGAREWWTRFEDRPVFPSEVSVGEVTAGAQWAGAEITDITARVDRDVPEGTRVLLVRLDVEPLQDAVGCRNPVLRELDGEHREWSAASGSLMPRGADAVTECPDDSAAPFELVIPYVVPADAGALALDVDVAVIRPGFLRFPLG